MEEKLAILAFLSAAGFKENGKDQYFKEGVGRLLIRSMKTVRHGGDSKVQIPTCLTSAPAPKEQYWMKARLRK